LRKVGGSFSGMIIDFIGKKNGNIKTEVLAVLYTAVKRSEKLERDGGAIDIEAGAGKGGGKL